MNGHVLNEQPPREPRLTFYASRPTLHVSRISRHAPRCLFRRAFTLMELMIVVGIMGIALTIGVPIVYKVWHRTPMVQAIRDFREVCSNARAQAILQGRPVDLVFHPQENRVEIAAAAAPASSAVAPGDLQTASGVSSTPPPAAHSGFSAHFSDRVMIQDLDINMSGINYAKEETARVRFYPNGTSDEMWCIFFDGRDHYAITLEVTTGLADVKNEADLERIRNRLQ